MTVSSSWRAVTAAPRPGYAAERLERMIGVALGIAACARTVAHIDVIVGQWPMMGASLLIGLSVTVLPAILAAVASAWGSLATARRLWMAEAVGVVLAYVSAGAWLLATKAPGVEGTLWLSPLGLIGACAAALAWSERIALLAAYIGTLQIVVMITLVLTADDPFVDDIAGEAVRQLFNMVMFPTLICAVVIAGRMADNALAVAIAEAETAARAETSRIGRRRVQLLVHDRVLTALLAHAQGASRERVRVQAAEALRELRSAADRPSVHIDTAGALAERLRATTSECDPAARFDMVLEAAVPMPAAAGAALIDAAAEALRNSIRHAGDPASRPVVARHVHLTASGAGVEIVVLDDGVGFDTRQVDSARIGVRQGILERMRAVPGGSAEVRSSPSRGTAVILHWANAPADMPPPDDGRRVPGRPGSAGVDNSFAFGGAVPLVLCAWFIVCYSVASLVFVGQPARTPLGLAALAVSFVAAALLALPTPMPLVRWRTNAVMVAFVVLTLLALVSAIISSTAATDLAFWELRAALLLACGLAVRGRVLHAWVVCTFAALVLVGWSYAITESALLGLRLALPSLLSLAAVSAFAMGLKRSARQIDAYRTAERASREKAAGARAMDLESMRELHAVRIATEPLLMRLAADAEVDTASSRALEAEQRDRIRGKSLVNEPLTTVLREARLRGTEVRLLDDLERRALTDPQRHDAAVWTADQLLRAAGQTVTVRIAEERGTALVSVTVDGAPFAEHVVN